MKSCRVGDNWVEVRQATPIEGLNSYEDREWFVYDYEPEKGGKLLGQGRVTDPPNNVDPDRAAGNAAIAWMLANNRGVLQTEITW